MEIGTMNISKYQKLFGVGPIGMLIGMVMLGLLWLLDKTLRHVEISSRPRIIRIIGLILIMLWICWHSWCIRTISRWWRHDQLCTTGPYRFVRHPIYAGGVLLGSIGMTLMFNSWIMLPLPVLMYATYSILVRKEEAMMTAVFGEEYKRYAANTGRLFPRIPREKKRQVGPGFSPDRFV
jgi:protein-S-isoprenylcysteine O-methyltransferase Ste14